MYIQRTDPSHHERGFTLIELMVTVAIMAILAGIAVPSYQKYTIDNAEAEAKAAMMNVSLQAKRARAKHLSYKNFTPSVGYADGGTKKKFCIPTTANCKYEVVFTDTAGKSLTDATSNANAWVMFATPKTSMLTSANAHKFRLESNGTACYFEKGSDADYDSVTKDTSCTSRKKWEK